MENAKSQSEASTGENAKKFRDFAAECRRLAQRATDNDRKILIDIADAWIACAEEAERREKLADKTGSN